MNIDSRMAQANRNVLARLSRVKPAWTAVRTARQALQLPSLTLLHAGPPLQDPCKPPAPVLASAVLCCLHEGWAKDRLEAVSLIASGEVSLLPAQQFGAVTPLAAVISPGTMLVEVADLNDPGTGRRAWSLLGSGAGPQIRFGSANPAILARLAWRDGPLAAALAAALESGPLDLTELAAIGLAGGDDLHARTTSANAALCARLLPRIREGADGPVSSMLTGTPLFFLTLWMAACHLMLDSAADGGSDPASTMVIALAGNGEQAGIRLAGSPSEWTVVTGSPPAGPRLDPRSTALPLPVIGDSGVIDAAGFGGQALSFSAEIQGVLADWLPPHRQESTSLLAGEHPAFGSLGVKVGLDAALVKNLNRSPLTAIAMIDAAGEQGLLGRGLYVPPVELFSQAVNWLQEKNGHLL